jgi:NitT/TauT family transport system substrate-binding protein
MRGRHAFRYLSLGFAAAFAIVAASSASAADKVMVGKAFPGAFPFSPADIGVQEGIFAKYGIDATLNDFMGAAKLEQGIASGDIDIGLGSGTDMAFIVKGAPDKAVAAMAGPPLSYGIFVPADGGIKTIADLEGKRQAVASPNSLVAWMLRHFSLLQGWGETGIVSVYVSGSTAASLAALKTHQVDMMNAGTDVAYGLEKRGEGKLIVNYGKYIKTFITHAIFANNTLIAQRPDVLRRFLKAWFETVAYMNSHKDESAKIVSTVDGVNDIEVARKSYDEMLPMMLLDGHFDPEALKIVATATVELQLLEKEPDMTQLYTEAFLPAKN